MTFDIGTVLEAVGAVVGVGVPASGFVYLSSKWFIEKWMEHRFAERLQFLKAEQDAALKHIQSSIDHQIHRAKKLYDTEFEVITKAWNMLEAMYGHSINTTHTAPFYGEWNNATKDDIRRVLDEEIEHPYTETEKIQVLEADDPAKEWSVVFDQRRVKIYEAASMEFAHYLGSNGIFMRRDIRDKFKELSRLFTAVFSEFASNIRREQRSSFHYMRLNQDGIPLRRELADLIDQRLWSATETEPQGK